MIPSFYYRVCDKCANTERVPSDDARPYRCGYCGSAAGWEFTTLSKAEQHSQDILERRNLQAAS